ncbi:MAG: hypothetical protein GY934_07570, partial [Gammaproteobacteria bacterium]|nr:hypothetical protein [Gammaproteobacteria bacterium]
YGDQTYFRLRVFANYADGSREDVTRISNGINYTISNPDIAQVDFNGILQGLSSGRVLITARKDGTSAVLSVTIVTTGDSDEDGLPDDFEQANGLDPNDPVDAFEDADGDGLSALDEYQAGTEVNNTDTDGDDISDGEEAIEGNDGFITNPLLADSDNDGINDGLEVAVGTDPTDINDVNLGASIAGLDVDPESVVITFNSIQGSDASAQLTVLGTTLDGETIDLTRTDKGTNYTTSDTNICNFGGRDGEVFAGLNGSCVVTADNSGFSDTSDIDVRSFDPIALNYLTLADTGNTIDVDGSYAYIGTNDGLVVVDVTDPGSPVQVGALSLGTQVADIKVQGQYAYLATSTVALVVVDISDVTNPLAVTSLGAGTASADLALSRNQLYVAAQAGGLWVINIANPAFPQQTDTIPAASSIKAVAVSPAGNLVAVVDDRAVRVFDRQAGGLLLEAGSLTLPNPSDLTIDDGMLYVADLSQGLTLIDISDTNSLAVTGVTPWINAGRPNDVVMAGNFAFLADTSFPNGLPIVEISNPAAPLPRAVIDFRTLGLAGADGFGIDVDTQYIYVVTTQGLQIAQYQQFIDENGLPPEVSITAPLSGDTALEGGTITVTAEAQDDVAVAGVSFFVDDELIYTDISAPYGFEVPLPIATSTASLSVQALDYGGSSSPAASVLINLLADSDYDGLSDNDETQIHGTSPFAADTDDDGLSDPAELALGYDPLDGDMDNDGLPDGEEINPGADGYVTNPYDPDSDNDGMPDGFESRFGLNPLSGSDANTDLDGDGFSNLEEYRQGFDPTTADSDADGMPDEYERQYGLDPLNPNDYFGDIDGDGVPNGVEYVEGTDPSNPDVTPPQVASLMPSDGQGMPANSVLLVRFNEPMKVAALDEINASMMDVLDQPVDGTVSLSSDGYVLAFNPALNLNINAEYTFSLSGARDVAGNPMAVVYTATVTTSALADNVAPIQLAASPYHNASGVPVNTLLTLDYDEIVDPTILIDANFYLYDEQINQKVPGGIGISEDGKRLHFVPKQALLVGRDYYLYVSNIRDLSGNSCSNCGSYQRIYFETAFAPDETAPLVLASTVSENDSDIPLNARFVVKFDEPIGPLFSGDVELISNSTPVDVGLVISSDRKQITITPLSLLTASAQHNLTVNNVVDLSGNATALYSAVFVTGVASDTATGAITAWSIPGNNTQNVPLNALLEVTLSERVDPTSINSSSFYLYDRTEGRKVAGNWALSSGDRVLTFTPDALLEADHRYDLNVGYHPYLKDLAGNYITQNTQRYFYTGGSVDEAAPVLVQSSIEEGSTVVPVNGRIVLTLNEPIGDACSPIVEVQSAGVPVESALSITTDRRTLTITPDQNLSASTEYTVSVTNLCDYAGNALSDDLLNFTTLASDVADTTAPSLVSITPTNNATGVSVSTPIVMEFNEPIDAQSAPPVTGGGVTVLGDYVVSGNTLTFTPAAPLQGGIQY